MEIDLSNKCRACLKDDEEKRNIFAELHDGISLLDIFTSTTCFEINKQDGLSHFMCKNCTKIVVDFHNFKKMYQITEKQIRAMLLSRVDVLDNSCDTEEGNGMKKEEQVFPKTVHNMHGKYLQQHLEVKFDCNSDTSGESHEDKADHGTDEELKISHNDCLHGNETSLSNEDLGKHLMGKHKKNSRDTINVETCSGENNEDKADEHELHEEETKIIHNNCLHCNELFLSNEDLVKHLISKHTKSSRNKKTIKTCNNAKKPEKKAEPKDMYCKKCDKTFVSDEDYEEHMKCHKPNVCLICGTGFAKKWDLTEHLDVHLVERTHVCGFCKKTFQRKTVLSKHRRICPKKPAKIESKPPKDLFCTICNRTFDCIKDCKEHNAKLHKTFICHICGRSFAKKWDLKEHVDVHLDQRTHVCEFCSKTFQRKSVLVKHRKLHTHPLKELCTMCGKSFTYRSDLKLHIKLLHTKIRDLACTICGAKFNVRSNLKKHVRRHQERQKDFRCEECPSEYKDRGSLKRHVLERHSESFVKPVCDICGKQFTCTAHLNRHLKNVHKKVADSSDRSKVVIVSEPS